MAIIHRVKTRLKENYKDVNLSRERVKRISERIAKKLTEESTDDQIDEALDAADEVYPFADIAKDDDRLRAAEAKKPDEKKPDDAEKPDEKKPDEKKPDDKKPDDIAALITAGITAALAPVLKELTGLKADKTTGTRETKLQKALEGANEKFKGSKLKDFKRIKFETDEDFEEWLEEVTDDSADFKEISTTINTPPPNKSTQQNGAGKKATEAELDKIMPDIMR